MVMKHSPRIVVPVVPLVAGKVAMLAVLVLLGQQRSGHPGTLLGRTSAFVRGVGSDD